jgi:hypothetical protein
MALFSSDAQLESVINISSPTVAAAAVSLGVSFALCLLCRNVFATFKRLEIALQEKEADGMRKRQSNDLRSLVTGNLGIVNLKVLNYNKFEVS